MRLIIISLLLLASIKAFGQRGYRIGNMIWEYQKPKEYKIRTDNFEDAIQKGDSFLKANGVSDTITQAEKMLFSFAKSDSSDLNAVLASYRGNLNIKNFTLEGYSKKLLEFLKSNYRDLGSECNSKLYSITIDKITFYVIELQIKHINPNYTYNSLMYIADINNLEFNIAAVYDNEIDKQKITESIKKSTFIRKL